MTRSFVTDFVLVWTLGIAIAGCSGARGRRIWIDEDAGGMADASEDLGDASELRDGPAAPDGAEPTADASSPCPAELTLCDSACVDTRTDPRHCTACGVACAAGDVCGVSGCMAGPTDCRVDGCTGFTYCDAADGMCKAGCTSNAQCSTNEVCELATHSCVCGAGSHRCGSVCASDYETATCGARCVACPTDPLGSSTCDGTSCGIECGADTRVCGGRCASCPTTGVVTSACAGDACVATECALRYYMCSGACQTAAACGVAELAAGVSHTCARIASGNIECWGASVLGTVLADAVQLASGSDFVCARRMGGSVTCWGSNTYGQLGNGTTTGRGPTTVAGLTDAIDIAAGFEHACALRATGTVVCWGANFSGQLGDGTRTQRTTPVAVSGLTGVLAIAVGSEHSCALRSGGAVSCWGDNYYGQLGLAGMYGDPRSTPVTVSTTFTSAAEIVAGGRHTCVRRSTGTVSCWGDNRDGQLGNGTFTTSATVVPVFGSLFDAVALTAGTSHTCARRASGAVACWGNNASGQLGDATLVDRNQPVAVSGLSDAAEVTSGTDHTCARRPGGALVCWGTNASGQLGDGTRTASSIPVAVTVLSPP